MVCRTRPSGLSCNLILLDGSRIVGSAQVLSEDFSIDNDTKVVQV